MKKTPTSLVLTAVLAIAGCGYSPRELAQLKAVAKENGVLVSFPGLASDEARRMTSELAKELEMAHIDGRKNQDSKDILDAGESSQYGNQIVFHSLGERAAQDFTKWCYRNGIEFETGHSLGSYYGLHFPENIREIFNDRSDFPWREKDSTGGQNYHPGEVIDGSMHPWLPWNAKPIIKDRIENPGKRKKHVYQKIPTKSGR